MRLSLIMALLGLSLLSKTASAGSYTQYPWTEQHHQLYDYAHKHAPWILKNGKEMFKNYEAHREFIHKTALRHRVPREVAVIAAIESSFDPKAVSHAGAAGLWQLMPPTARDMGLRVDDEIDERFDPEKSTVAAIKYLRWLADQFGGNFETAIIAYNYGIGRTKRVSEKVKSLRAFTIMEHDDLPQESKDYLLKFLTYLHYFNHIEETRTQ